MVELFEMVGNFLASFFHSNLLWQLTRRAKNKFHNNHNLYTRNPNINHNLYIQSVSTFFLFDKGVKILYDYLSKKDYTTRYQCHVVYHPNVSNFKFLAERCLLF